MAKLKRLILDNIPILSVLFTTLLIVIIIIFKPSNSQSTQESNSYDTSNFNIISTKEAVGLFENSNSQVLVICRSTCSACASFVPTLNSVSKMYKVKINYLDLETMDLDGNDTKKLKKLLNFEYTYDDKTASFSEFIGLTPMFIILKNKEMVYGYIGTMNLSVVKTILENYEVI